jgi:uncharacterized membrane protein YbhN (UPF0104 family)
VSWLRRLGALALTALVLYGAAPALLDVINAWPKAKRIEPRWWAAMVACEAGSLFCLWRLQVACIQGARTWPVASSQLASGALGRVVPGGAATAAAAQYAMLGAAGVRREAIALGLAAATVLQLVALSALPLTVIPVVIAGLRVPDGLLPGLFVAAGLFVGMVAVAVVVLRFDGVLRAVARAARALLWRVGRHGDELDALPERVVAQRDQMIKRLGRRWIESLAAAVGRWLLDFFALGAAIAATGEHPRVSLVLLAYVGAQLLGQIPITPGGLGIVEAGLTGLLVAAGMSGGAAAVATLAYRLVSYWLLLPAGLVGWVFRPRGSARSTRAPAGGPG